MIIQCKVVKKVYIYIHTRTAFKRYKNRIKIKKLFKRRASGVRKKTILLLITTY